MASSHLPKSHPPSIKSYTSLSCPFTQFFIYLKFSSTSFSLLLLCGQFTYSQESPSKHQIIYVSLLSIYTIFYLFKIFKHILLSPLIMWAIHIFLRVALPKSHPPSIKSYTSLSCPFTQFFIYLKFSSTSFSLLLLCRQFTSSQESPSKHQIIYVSLLSIYTIFYLFKIFKHILLSPFIVWAIHIFPKVTLKASNHIHLSPIHLHNFLFI